MTGKKTIPDHLADFSILKISPLTTKNLPDIGRTEPQTPSQRGSRA